MPEIDMRKMHLQLQTQTFKFNASCKKPFPLSYFILLLLLFVKSSSSVRFIWTGNLNIQTLFFIYFFSNIVFLKKIIIVLILGFNN